MHADVLDLPTLPRAWQALVTEDGEPFAAYVRGHVSPFRLAADAETCIVKAFAAVSPECAADSREIIDEAGGAVLTQFWLRPSQDHEEGTFLIASSNQRHAFPVTGVRFL